MSNRLVRIREERTNCDRGFTLVELLVAMTLFLIFSAVVLTAVVTMSKGLDKARVTSDISAEARIALERIAREVRQAESFGGTLTSPAASLTTKVDFNGNGVIDGSLDDPETVTYAFVPGSSGNPGTIRMTAQDSHGATLSQSLLAGQVAELRFDYTSSDWRRDVNGNGIVTLAEAGADGVDRVAIRLVVERDDQDEVFSTEVTLRNRSQS